MEPDYVVEFVQDDGLKSEASIEVKKSRPVDEDGIYDPFTELTFTEFVKLVLDEQVEYLLASTYTVMKEWTIFQINLGMELPSGDNVTIALDRDKINPRVIPLPDRYGAYNNTTELNHVKYKFVILQVKDNNGMHNIRQNSVLFRTVIIGLLLAFLIKFKPEKFKIFAEASSYYATALIIGNGEKLPKFRLAKSKEKVEDIPF